MNLLNIICSLNLFSAIFGPTWIFRIFCDSAYCCHFKHIVLVKRINCDFANSCFVLIYRLHTLWSPVMIV